jgi:hypothetical protein
MAQANTCGPICICTQVGIWLSILPNVNTSPLLFDSYSQPINRKPKASLTIALSTSSLTMLSIWRYAFVGVVSTCILV